MTFFAIKTGTVVKTVVNPIAKVIGMAIFHSHGLETTERISMKLIIGLCNYASCMTTHAYSRCAATTWVV